MIKREIKYIFVKSLTFCVALLFLLFKLFFAELQFNLDTNEIDSAIEKSIDYISDAQLSSGHFSFYCCRDEDLRDCIQLSSNHVSAVIAYSLDFVDDSRIKEMVDKCIQKLRDEEFESGTWHVIGKEDPSYYIIADTDTVAAVAGVLELYGFDTKATLKTLMQYRNTEGLFYTWIINPPTEEAVEEIEYVVNSHILFYLSLMQHVPEELCSYFQDLIASNFSSQNSLYYLNEYVSIYYLMKAYRAGGAYCLRKSITQIKNKLLDEQKEDGSWGGVLDTALVVCSLEEMKMNNKLINAIERAITFILSQQNEDGSWNRDIFFRLYYEPFWYGSEAVNTALCLEALSKYLKLRQENR